eukprot:CAMPEP_0206034970 /NCGR_PEP_ID=MMETSP1466-20131121/1746_1 /ASSEMBLY_ACC=CAM_ASM_001126 /TAXON_ID=44452 /ORGANISM="Pavlova gyrans, Strain CCMP608" /LENGTH=40 /DNA_ID= /DNA_START= /DNA_END= /DNA_ORIENTATION=
MPSSRQPLQSTGAFSPGSLLCATSSARTSMDRGDAAECMR